MTKRTLLSVAVLAFVSVFSGQSQINPAGATETTPSHSEYFSWINHSFEGPTEKTTLAGLDFFRYLKETYGTHGTEWAWAGFKIDGEYVGCPDRAPSYPSNTWECSVRQTDSNCTYCLPLTEDMKGKKIEAFVLDRGMGSSKQICDFWQILL